MASDVGYALFCIRMLFHLDVAFHLHCYDDDDGLVWQSDDGASAQCALFGNIMTTLVPHAYK